MGSDLPWLAWMIYKHKITGDPSLEHLLTILSNHCLRIDLLREALQVRLPYNTMPRRCRDT